MQWFPTPNYDKGRTDIVRWIIIHASRSGIPGNDDWTSTINHFANPYPTKPQMRASSHVLLARDGREGRFVADEDTAWHAGFHNPYTLGVELEQPTIDTPFTEVQINKLVLVVQEWHQKYGLLPCIGHEGTPQGIAGRKTDPGYLFPWKEFMERINMTEEEKLRLACLELANRWSALVQLGQTQQVVNEAKKLGVVAQN